MEKSDLVIAQEFLPTAFDWRIGVVDGKALYACRYYMAKAHWQIVKRDDEGRVRDEGLVDTMAPEQAPKTVLRTALAAAKLIGNGLYGVDLKQIGRKCYVIEVNDNPSSDGGIEDRQPDRDVYEEIMQVFLRRMEAKVQGNTPRA
jgi:glutathione synthase/RimK-type ligase-like ATP-grasp enzyme